MNLKFTIKDLDSFTTNVYKPCMQNNKGGMRLPDLFSFYYTLKQLQPKVVIESGVFKGISTRLIRETLPDVQIICIDPNEENLKNGYVDSSEKTKYYTGKKFIDFNDIDWSSIDKDNTLVFFDDHINAVERLISARNSGFKHLFFNDNYPVGGGSHYSLEHEKNKNLNKNVFDLIEVYKIFPGVFKHDLTGFNEYILEENENNKQLYNIWYKERNNYRWNTYVLIKSKEHPNTFS